MNMKQLTIVIAATLVLLASATAFASVDADESITAEYSADRNAVLVTLSSPAIVDMPGKIVAADGTVIADMPVFIAKNLDKGVFRNLPTLEEGVYTVNVGDYSTTFTVGEPVVVIGITVSPASVNLIPGEAYDIDDLEIEVVGITGFTVTYEMEENDYCAYSPLLGTVVALAEGQAVLKVGLEGIELAPCEVTFNVTGEPIVGEPITITWVNYDGTVLASVEGNAGAEYPAYPGETPVKPSTEEYRYVFTGFDNGVVDSNGNVTFTAQFSEYPITAMVAKVNGVEYATVEEAYASVEDGTRATVEVIADASWNSIELKDKVTLKIGAGKTVSGKLVSENNVITLDNATAGTGGLLFTIGSIAVSGNLADGDIQVDSGIMTVAKGKTFTVENGASVTVNEGAIFDIPQGTTSSVKGGVENDGIFMNEGTLVVSGEIVNNSTMTNEGSISVDGQGKIPDNFINTGSIDLGAQAQVITVSGVLTTDTFPKEQTVIVTGDLAISTIVSFGGKVIINEGVTVTVNDGAGMKFSGTLSQLINNGNIVVKSNKSISAIDIGDFSVFENNGSVSLEGKNSVTSDEYEGPAAMIVISGNGILNDNGVLSVKKGGIVVNTGAVNLNADVTVDNGGAVIGTGLFVNKATFTINGTFAGMLMNSANVVVDSPFTEMALVNSSGASITINGLTGSITYSDVTNTISIECMTENDESQYSKFGGLTIATSTKGKNTVCTVSGDMSVVSTKDKVEPQTYVVDFLTGTFNIDSNVTADKNVLVSNEGVLAITGCIMTTDAEIQNAGVITGARWVEEVKDGDKLVATLYYYSTLDAAISAGITDITLYGDYVVSSDLTIPEGTKITQNEGTFTIADGATLTVSDKASITTSTVFVDGTMVLVKSAKVNAEIVSDVINNGTDMVTYTNIVKAIREAKSGDTIVLNNENVVISKAVTLGEGVTLKVDDGQKLTVEGVTFTVNGIIDLVSTSDGISVVAAEGKTGPVAGHLVLNGMVKSDDTIDYIADSDNEGSKIPGAYYTITNNGIPTYYIEPLSNALAKVADAEDNYLVVYGKNTVDGVLSNGTVEATPYAEIVGNLNLDNAEVQFVNGAKLNGTVADATGSIATNGAVTGIISSSDKFVVTDFDVAAKTLTIGGTVEAVGLDAETVNVPADAKLVIKEASEVATLNVDGTVQVSEALGVVELLVSEGGIVSIDNDKALAVVADATVLGTLAAAEATEDAGAGTAVIAGNVYAGITEIELFGVDFSELLKANAVVSGQVAVASATYVAPGATVSDSITKAVGVKSVTLDVAGSTYVTIYSADEVYLPDEDSSIVVNNAVFAGEWMDEWGLVVDNPYLPDNDTLYAVIDYDIYHIKIVTDDAIRNIAIDGEIVGAGLIDRAFSAGEYTVTAQTVTGYEGEIQLGILDRDKDYVSVNGMKFTLQGVPTDVITLQLTGTVAVDPNQGSGTDVSGLIDAIKENTDAIKNQELNPTINNNNNVNVDDNKGMGITDYLLIVIVILLIVMAIIVALRMLRK
jgi:hypothetical protein